MPTTIPAIRGNLGSTEFFVTTMKIRELTEKVIIPKEMDGWDDLSVEERFQRDIDSKRVERYIAPYFAADPDRFCGALIVAVQNHDGMTFEAITDVAKTMPGLYKTTAANIGFLTLNGGELLIPLDGQHRLKALEFAITGKNDRDESIAGLTQNTDLAAEEVSVILVRYEAQKARKIFNKVNRYAKPTSKAQNLITDDDDIVAVFTRDVADKIIGARLVNYTSNTLNKQSECFTTLATIYDATETVLSGLGHKIDKASRPDKAKEKLLRSEVETTWQELAVSPALEVFRLALYDKAESGDAKRRELRATYLLGKPVGQLAVIKAYLRLKTGKLKSGAQRSPEKSCEVLNAIDWSVENAVWQRVLMNGEKVASGKTVVAFAAEFIAYLAGEVLSAHAKEALEQRYRNLFPKDEQSGIKLPPPISS